MLMKIGMSRSKLLWRASLFEECPNIHKYAMGPATVTIQAAVRKLFASRKADVMRKATRNSNECWFSVRPPLM